MVIGWVTSRWMDGWSLDEQLEDGWMDGWMVIGWVNFTLFWAFPNTKHKNKTKLWSSHCAHWMICCVVYWLHRCLLVRLICTFIHSTVAQHRLSSSIMEKKATHLQPTRGRRRIPLDAGSSSSKHQTKPNQTKVAHTPLALPI